jgi:hypothetical protein
VSERARVRDELEAAIEARRELGSELEPHLIESFVERIEKRLDERRPVKPAPSTPERGMVFVMALVSVGASIPLTAIAISNGGLTALAIVWLGLVLVNLAFARAR